MKYEDMKKDEKGELQRVGEFLGSPNYSNDDLEMIVNETSFKQMKSRPMAKTFHVDLENITSFFRKGEVGSWKELFQLEQEAYVDKRVQNELNSVGMSFN